MINFCGCGPMKKMKIPTKLQKKTVAILRENPDMPVGRAMRQAGYKPSTSVNSRRDFLELKGTAIAIEKWREALRGSGLDEVWLMRKYKEWGEAKKIKSSLTGPDIEVPDYETQLKVKDDIRGDLGLPVMANKTQTAVQVNVMPILGGISRHGGNDSSRKD